MITLFENDKPLTPIFWEFPGKEIGVKLPDNFVPDPIGVYLIEAKLPDSKEVTQVVHLADALYRAGVPTKNVTLYLPYLPYARQDRVCHPGEAFALEVFLKMLSAAPVGHVSTLDAHSQVAVDLMNQYFPLATSISQWELTEDLPDYDVIIAPDAGAVGKIKDSARDGTKIVVMSKTRDGIGRVVYEPLQVGEVVGKACVIDDLCDGGATFLALSQSLHATQPEMHTLDLYVTHGLFSRGVGALLQAYDTLYCYNLLNQDSEVVNNVRVLGS